jgi:methyltransferase
MTTVVILLLVALQRLAELRLASANTKRLLEQGGREIGAWQYPFIVALHVGWLLGLLELAPGHAANWGWLFVFLLLQALRVWVIATLGRRWTTRIIVLPGAPLVRGGPFEFIAHPNYAIVAAEIAVLPLAFGIVGYALCSRCSTASSWPSVSRPRTRPFGRRRGPRRPAEPAMCRPAHPRPCARQGLDWGKRPRKRAA